MILTDAIGDSWDLANPNLINCQSDNAGASVKFVLSNGAVIGASIAFATAKAAFDAS